MILCRVEVPPCPAVNVVFPFFFSQRALFSACSDLGKRVRIPIAVSAFFFFVEAVFELLRAWGGGGHDHLNEDETIAFVSGVR